MPFGAARLLGVNPYTLRSRICELGIDWTRFAVNRRPLLDRFERGHGGGLRPLGSGKYLADHVSSHIGQPEVATGIAIGQLLVV